MSPVGVKGYNFYPHSPAGPDPPSLEPATADNQVFARHDELEKRTPDLMRPLQAIIPLGLLVIGSAFAAPMSPNAGVNSQLDAAQLARIQGGEILVHLAQSDRQPRGSVEAVVWIDASAESIWRIMTDCDAAPEFVPGLKACRVLESGDNWEIIRHDVKWMWLFPKVAYVFRADYQIHRQITFKRLRGDFREMKGMWRLRPMADGRHTIVHYSVYLDPGFLVPGWIVRRSLKKNLPAVLAALRDRVEGEHKAIPP